MVDIETTGAGFVDVDKDTSSYGKITKETDYGAMKITQQDGIRYNLVNITADYTVKRNDDLIISRATSDIEVTLIPAAIGKQITIKNHSSIALTITGDIEGGLAEYILTNLDESVILTFDGTEWVIVASHLI